MGETFRSLTGNELAVLLAEQDLMRARLATLLGKIRNSSFQ